MIASQSSPGDRVADLADFLARSAPFNQLSRAGLVELSHAARRCQYQDQDLVLDAFASPRREMGVVLDGAVTLRMQPDGPTSDRYRLGPGEVFGFSAMLSQEPVGPRVVAAGPVTVAWLPEQAVLPAFATPGGARYLAAEVAQTRAADAGAPSFTLVEELVTRPPLVLPEASTVAEVARAMTERDSEYAAFRRPDGGYAMITDRILRTDVLAAGGSADTPAAAVWDTDPTVAHTTESTAEAMIALLDRGGDVVLVLDRAGELRGAVCPRDFALSPSSAGVALHEQLRHASTAEELVDRARQMPLVLADLLGRGLAAGKVVAVYSAMIDTTIRRALALTFGERPDLDLDAFTWLSLGSNGRREAVPSSDIDSAVSFLDPGLGPAEIAPYREALAELGTVLGQAGLSHDPNGATASRAPFARTAQQWREAARGWLADPVAQQGAIMTSLLVDGRPIHGDPGLTEVAQVFSDLRAHPGTMRLLLRESLAKRARQRSVGDILARRRPRFDLKEHALLPIVNIGRWAGLAVGSTALPTVDRLRAAAGSTILPDDRSDILIEVFGVLQRIRLEWQLRQWRAGEPADDVLDLRELSPLDRTVIAEAVREIAAGQRRMDNVSAFLAPADWATPAP